MVAAKAAAHCVCVPFPTSGSSTSCRALATSASDSAPHYAEADIISLQESSDCSISSITAVNIHLFAGADSSMREFPRDKLTFKEKLGEGQFGEVYLALLFVGIRLVFKRSDSGCDELIHLKI